MRIVHVISNLGIGGAETMLVRLVREQAGKPISHSVVSFLPGGAYAEVLRELGTEVVELKGERSVRSANLLRPLGVALAQARPDLVQGWMYHGNIAASLAALLRYHRAPVLWGVRQTLERLADNRPLTRGIILAGSALRFHPRRVIYNSTAAAEQHEAYGYPKAKRVTIYNGIDTRRFRPNLAARLNTRAALGLAPDAEVIGRVARNDPMKDHATLFKAFAQVAGQRPRAHLVVIGTGMDASDPELAQLARSTAASERVHFMGPQFKLEELVPAFDIAVSSSRMSEGFQNVLAEAMACGVPAVSTNIGEAATIIDDPARLVPRQNPEALAAAVMGVLDLAPERRRQMARRDRERIESRFEIGAAAAQFEEVWRSVIAERSGAHADAERSSSSP
jgi:glycosyltransferase involved in cell wall biosynthesis